MAEWVINQWKWKMSEGVEGFRLPTWAITAIVGLGCTVGTYVFTSGAKSNQLDSVITQTAKVQVSLEVISDKLSKIDAHQEAGDTKFVDLDRRVTNIESLVERNREELEEYRSSHK